MYGYERAAAEYERNLSCPCDKGGALWDYEEEIRERETCKEDEADREYDERKAEKGF